VNRRTGAARRTETPRGERSLRAAAGSEADGDGLRRGKPRDVAQPQERTLFGLRGARAAACMLAVHGRQARCRTPARSSTEIVKHLHFFSHAKRRIGAWPAVKELTTGQCPLPGAAPCFVCLKHQQFEVHNRDVQLCLVRLDQTELHRFNPQHVLRNRIKQAMEHISRHEFLGIHFRPPASAGGPFHQSWYWTDRLIRRSAAAAPAT